jgi:L-ascorbate metabolism protein UlaG (beta-lactamase superfamily)
MQLTKLGHACVRLTKDSTNLVIDPGVWAGPGALDEAAAILVTHEHADHLDANAIRAAMTANHDLELWSNASVTEQLADLGGRVHTVVHGDAVTAAGFDVHVYGSEHALLDSAIPVVANTGFAVAGQVFHPGDSYTRPEDRVPTLLVPVSAPWLKFGDLADYLRQADADRGYWIHDALLNDKFSALMGNLLNLVPLAAGPASYLEPGTTVDL